MKKFLFVSRHTPTGAQLELARQAGIELVHVGDADAFTIDARDFAWASIDGFVVVHPAAALKLAADGFEIGIFENGNRAAPDEPPKFEAVALHIFAGSGPFDLGQETVRTCILSIRPY